MSPVHKLTSKAVKRFYAVRVPSVELFHAGSDPDNALNLECGAGHL